MKIQKIPHYKQYLKELRNQERMKIERMANKNKM